MRVCTPKMNLLPVCRLPPGARDGSGPSIKVALSHAQPSRMGLERWRAQPWNSCMGLVIPKRGTAGSTPSQVSAWYARLPPHSLVSMLGCAE